MNTISAGTEISALLGRADDYVRSGDPQTAMIFYQTALRSAQAARFVDQLTLERLRNAQAFIQTRAQEFHHSLDTFRGVPEG